MLSTTFARACRRPTPSSRLCHLWPCCRLWPLRHAAVELLPRASYTISDHVVNYNGSSMPSSNLFLWTGHATYHYVLGYDCSGTPSMGSIELVSPPLTMIARPCHRQASPKSSRQLGALITHSGSKEDSDSKFTLWLILQITQRLKG